MSLNPSATVIKRVLVTGATSYLGRVLIERLQRQGSIVHVIVRPGSDLSRLQGLSGTPECHEHDGSTETLIDIVAKANPSTIFHLATLYLREHQPNQIEDLIQSNILFGTQLLEAMRMAGMKRLINLGTFFQFFDGSGYCPVNLYAATKQAFEDILTYYRDAHKISSTTLILYDVYGPGDWRAKLMTAIRDAQTANTVLKLTDATTLLDLVYIDDVVEALMHAALQQIEGGPYAISGPARTTLAGVVEIFEKVKGLPITVEFGAYPAALRTPNPPWVGPPLQGWQARISLEEGIRRFLEGTP